MMFEDTHLTEAELAGIDGNSFHMAAMSDESGARPRYLFCNAAIWNPNPGPAPWRRLVIHVPDVAAPGVADRLRAALNVELEDVPF